MKNKYGTHLIVLHSDHGGLSYLKKSLGEIVYFNVFGQPLLVLNSPGAAADLLDRRAGIYSDRPRNIVAGDILTGGLFVVFCGYTEM